MTSNGAAQTPDRRRSAPDALCEVFFGQAIDLRDDAALLGVSSATPGSDAVLQALEERLASIEAHPLGQTPEADELRMMCHAATARLVQGDLRSGSIDITPPVAGDEEGLHIIERDAVLSMAMHGGWNAEARRQIAVISISRGFKISQVLRALARLSSRGGQLDRRASSPQRNGGTAAPAPRRAPARPRSVAAPAAPRTAQPAPTPAPPSPPRAEAVPIEEPQGSGTMVAVAVVVLIAIMAAIGAFVVLSANRPAADGSLAANENSSANSNAQSVQRPPPPPAVGPAVAGPPESDQPAEPPAQRLDPSRYDDPALVVRELRALVQRAADEPAQTLGAFESAYEAVATWWPRYAPAQRVAALDAIISYVYEVADWSEVSETLTPVLARPLLDRVAPPDDPGADVTTRPAWATAVLYRLSGDRELASRVTRAADAALRLHLGDATPLPDAPVEAALAASIKLSAESLPRAAQADGRIEAWITAARAIEPNDEGVFASLALDAIERVLLDPALAMDRSEGAFLTVRMLTLELVWRRDAPAADRLLQWLADARVRGADLRSMMSILARESSAPDIGAGDTLPADPTMRDRVELADRLAASWGRSATESVASVTATWASRAQSVLADARADDEFARAARVTTLVQAGAAIWRGEVSHAADLVEFSSKPDPLSRPRSRAVDPDGYLEQGGSWAVRYLARRRAVAPRLELLDQMANGSPAGYGSADLEVLASEAVLGTPRDIRTQAQRVALVMRHRPELAVGMVELAPRLPRTRHSSDFIERFADVSLPPPTAPQWDQAARRALVEHALGALAAGQPGWRADALAARFAASYADRADASDALAARFVDASDAAGAAGLAWTARAATAPSSDALAQQRAAAHTGRLAIANGPIQRFIAEQLSIADDLAARVRSERVTDAALVASVMERLETDRRAAPDAIAQAMAIESAILRLWLIRLDADVGDVGATASVPAQPSGPGAPAPGRDQDLPVPAVFERMGDLSGRLSGLTPDDPNAYFELAEEVAAESSGESDRRLAQTLYVLSFSLRQQGGASRSELTRWARSTALGLAEVTSNSSKRQWLLALAASLAPAQRSVPSDTSARAEADSSPEAFRLAEALGFARAGFGRRARSALDDAAVIALLDEVIGVLESSGFGGKSALQRMIDLWPLCPECKNERVINSNAGGSRGLMLCPTCRGDPGERLTRRQLTAMLGLELMLLRGAHRSWAARVESGGAPPLREIEPSDMPSVLGVDPSRTLWRGGAWMAPPDPDA